MFGQAGITGAAALCEAAAWNRRVNRDDWWRPVESSATKASALYGEQTGHDRVEFCIKIRRGLLVPADNRDLLAGTDGSRSLLGADCQPGVSWRGRRDAQWARCTRREPSCESGRSHPLERPLRSMLCFSGFGPAGPCESAPVAFVDFHCPGQQIPSRCHAPSRAAFCAATSKPFRTCEAPVPKRWLRSFGFCVLKDGPRVTEVWRPHAAHCSSTFGPLPDSSAGTDTPGRSPHC